MPNRQELTDYAVSLLKESNEDAGTAEQAAAMVERAARNDPFNPIAFAIPLLVIGAVLCATGILAGVGLGIIGIAALMVTWGLIVAFFSRFRREKSKPQSYDRFLNLRSSLCGRGMAPLGCRDRP